MIVKCPRCHEQGLTYRYDEIYCIVCSHREYAVPKELKNFADRERRLQTKRNKEWTEMRNRSKYATKAVKVKISDVSSSKLRHIVSRYEERR